MTKLFTLLPRSLCTMPRGENNFWMRGGKIITEMSEYDIMYGSPQTVNELGTGEIHC